MPFATPALLEALNSPTTIPIIPFKNREIDYAGHAKNIDYLMRNNHLDNGRPRVISVAGTSLIHHLEPEDQTRIFAETGRVMGEYGVLMSAIVPNPIGTAGKLVAAQANLSRPPDVYLIMPLTGVANPEGIYEQFMQFGEHYGQTYGARFLYYLRNASERAAVIRLLKDSPHWVGVKVGTSEADVRPLIEGVGHSGLVIWGIGDRSTNAAELGTKGHTSGTAVLCTGICDGINNAQRRGDYAAARKLEAEIDALEELRFMNGRVYNYSAVVEAIHLSGFTDIVGGEGGPFNPRVPAEIAERVKVAIQHLGKYH